jgi:Na+/H+ antiporter NhaC
MRNSTGKILVILIGIVFLSAALALAHAERPNDVYEEEEGLELGVLSGLITFICVVSTVVIGRLMRKGKVKVTTHHALAYITVAAALLHGIYNLLTH